LNSRPPPSNAQAYAWPSGEVFRDLTYLSADYFFCAETFFVRGFFFLYAEFFLFAPKIYSVHGNIFNLPRIYFFHHPDFCFCSPKTFWCSAEIVGHPQNFIYFPENTLFIPKFIVSQCADFLFPAILGEPRCRNYVNDPEPAYSAL